MNYIISIINPDSLSILMDLCNQLDLPLSITMAGRGTAVQSMLDLLGIESNERRIVFTVANEEKTTDSGAKTPYAHWGSWSWNRDCCPY